MLPLRPPGTVRQILGLRSVEDVELERFDMPMGQVKWFNSRKGYGFIEPEDGGKDVFVHISALERAGIAILNEGQKVGFDLARDRGRISAVNLKLA